jgi:hypothetical protein
MLHRSVVRPRHWRRSLPLLALALAAPIAGPGAQAAHPPLPTDILGRWTGTSTCVKAAWNSACNDEVVTYWIEPRTGVADSVMFHAYKKVGDAWESMGDLSMGYSASARRWEAPFANSRVRILWTFVVEPDGGLTGRLFSLPDERVGRTVRATRDPLQRPPAQ